ncbi:hypothetical protein [Nocardiopsis protaetiae]|uniref:hypothetical protein n=1 Tax=Nocardiopsis protaetiae TaxID=3382270 RepID=UPI00387B0A39
MSPRFLPLARAGAGASAAAVLAVLAPALPAAAEEAEEVCAHARGDGGCALVLTGAPEEAAVREAGPWLEVPGRDPDCRTGEGVPVETVPGDDEVFYLAPGEETVHCDVTTFPMAAEPAEPAAEPEVAGQPEAALEPSEPPEGVEQETLSDVPEPVPSPSPSPSPSPECLDGEEAREWQRFPVERGGPCRGTPLAQWPDLEAAAEQAAQLAFADLADRLGVSVFDLAGHLGVDGVRGLSRRSVDELAAMLGITPRELVERAEAAAAAALAEEVSSALSRRGGLFGEPARLPDTRLQARLPDTRLPDRLPTRLPDTGGPRAAALVHGGVLLTAAGALILLLARRRIPS